MFVDYIATYMYDIVRLGGYMYVDSPGNEETYPTCRKGESS